MDKAHRAVDKQVEKIQRYIIRFYKDAQKSISATIKSYGESIQKESDRLYVDIKSAKTEAELAAAKKAYQAFYTKLVVSKKFNAFAKSLANDVYHANLESLNYINTKTARVYADNYNYIGKGLQTDLSGYSFKPVTATDANEYGQITKQTVDKKKDITWNSRNVKTAIVAGALMTKSGRKILSYAMETLLSKNVSSARRHVSDVLTDAESKGRLDSMYRASDEGWNIKKQWVAVLDNRTRPSHIEYDSEGSVSLDYEYNRGLKKPYDKDCPLPEEICNCRCSLVYDIGQSKGMTRAAREGEVTGSYKKASSFKGTQTVSVPNMTYKEWMEWRQR